VRGREWGGGSGGVEVTGSRVVWWGGGSGEGSCVRKGGLYSAVQELFSVQWMLVTAPGDYEIPENRGVVLYERQ